MIDGIGEVSFACGVEELGEMPFACAVEELGEMSFAGGAADTSDPASFIPTDSAN